ncbi:hypothetical protein [Natronococcus occultus]|uniref:Uncharacterized protein n=1 Tax=Natronococcus occultus SP4 TaxID=694430 RepID=L0K320_9EURY|nr:hypothetical protein [Natronococcus occultus]AGB38749.1 hypothetical protein Natoc_2995 [Natronococcus occultus SP4]
MDRRLFTKVAGASMVGALAGCTSPDEEESDETDDEATVEDDDEPADDEEPADDDDEPTDDEPGEGTDEDVDDEEPADDDEPVDNETEEEPDEEPADDEDADEEPEDEEEDETDDTDEDEAADDPSEPDELDAELVFDDELEGLLEVDHEFVWESDEGSHLCNINVEMENTSATAELYYEGIGLITDADGSHLASDVARFSLDPENSSEHSFSLDQCAETAAYRVEFEADRIVEE